MHHFVWERERQNKRDLHKKLMLDAKLCFLLCETKHEDQNFAIKYKITCGTLRVVRKVVMVFGSKNFDTGRVRTAIFGLGLENFPLKIPNVSILCPLGQKKFLKVHRSKPCLPPTYCGSKVWLGQIQGPSLEKSEFNCILGIFVQKVF